MVARIIKLTCTKHTHIPTVVKRMPSVLKLSYFTGWPQRDQYVKPGNAVTGITSRVCFIHAEWKYKEWCEVWWLITTLAAHCQSVLISQITHKFYIIYIYIYFILLTVHLVMILGKWPTWHTILFYIFISIVNMFRASSCSSSGESIVSIQHLVYVTLCRRPFRVQVWKPVITACTKREAGVSREPL
jgi:hypothetical protein